jgi:hypothetical protein
VQLILGHPDDAKADLDHCIRLEKNSETGQQCGAVLGKVR